MTASKGRLHRLENRCALQRYRDDRRQRGQSRNPPQCVVAVSLSLCPTGEGNYRTYTRGKNQSTQGSALCVASGTHLGSQNVSPTDEGELLKAP